MKNKQLILLLLLLHVIWKIIHIVPNSPKIYISFQVSIWTSWTPFSPCTANCGGGNQSRSRNCWNAGSDHYVFDCPGNSSDRRSCNTHRCTISNFYQKFRACLLWITQTITLVTAACTFLSWLGNLFLSGSSVLAKLSMVSNFTLFAYFFYLRTNLGPIP